MEPVVVKPFPLEQEYAKKTGITPEDIAKLRSWLSTQPHLPGDQITDLELVLVYHCCQCSAEVSKKVLDVHFTVKSLFDSIFNELVVTPTILGTLESTVLMPLKGRAHDGSAVIYCKTIDPDPKKYNYLDQIRAFTMIFDLWQMEEGTWPGFHIIMDMKMFSLQHFSKIGLQTVQQYVYYLQEAKLVKVKGIHYMNAPSWMDKVMALTKLFMKKELMGNLHVHQTGSSTLEQYVPMDALPEESGGKYISVMEAKANLQKRLQLNKEFFENRTKRCVVESRRPGKPKTISDIFGGVEGSFKKLDID